MSHGCNFNEKLAQGWRETRGNIAVELLKTLGGGSVLGAIWKAVSQTLHHAPVDWLLFSCLVVLGVILIIVALSRGGSVKSKESGSPATAESIRDGLRADLREKLEEGTQLSRAQEGLKRCEQERDVLKDVFSPLQFDAFSIGQTTA